MILCAYDAAKTGTGVCPSAPEQGSAAIDAAAGKASAGTVAAVHTGIADGI